MKIKYSVTYLLIIFLFICSGCDKKNNLNNESIKTPTTPSKGWEPAYFDETYVEYQNPYGLRNSILLLSVIQSHHQIWDTQASITLSNIEPPSAACKNYMAEKNLPIPFFVAGDMFSVLSPTVSPTTQNPKTQLYLYNKSGIESRELIDGFFTDPNDSNNIPHNLWMQTDPPPVKTKLSTFKFDYYLMLIYQYPTSTKFIAKNYRIEVFPNAQNISDYDRNSDPFFSDCFSERPDQKISNLALCPDPNSATSPPASPGCPSLLQPFSVKPMEGGAGDGNEPGHHP